MMPKLVPFIQRDVHQRRDLQSFINKYTQHSLHEILPSKYHILYINLNSFADNLHDLEACLHRLHQRGIPIHIIAATKIGIDKSTTKYCNLLDYNSFFGVSESGEGGVALFIHKCLTAGVTKIVENDDVNCLIANIKAIKLNISIFNYKNSNVKADTLLHRYSDLIFNENRPTLFFGDMNIDLSATSNACTTRYTDAIQKRGFVILNKIHDDFGTSSSSSSASSSSSSVYPLKSSITDHILSNIFHFNYTLSLRAISISPKKMIILGFDDQASKRINFSVEPPNRITHYKMIDFKLFGQHLQNMNFERVGVDSIDSLIQQINIHCKSKSIKLMEKEQRDHDRPWISHPPNSLALRIKMRDQFYAEKINKFNEHESCQQWLTIKEYLTNQLFKSRSDIDAIYDECGRILVVKSDIANHLNRYFLNIGKEMRALVPRQIETFFPEIRNNLYQIQYISTIVDEVIEKIDQIRICNNVNDSIPTSCLKYHKFQLASIMASGFNRCFREGSYPESLKIDRIVPILKSSLDPLDASNYRPISVPQNLSKLMESIICDRITEFCLDNDIIHRNQFGYLKHSSSMAAIISIVDKLQTDFQANPSSIDGCIFIDLKKASNTIPHDRLLDKLQRIGVRGPLHSLIKNYLYQRRQFVDMDGVLSEIVTNRNKFSVPQGSALGTLFVILYINDIFKLNLYGKLILYADDTTLVYVEQDLVTLKKQMESDLELVSRWFATNLLTINTEKTKAMIFNADNDDHQLQINLMIQNERIEFVQCHKYLGIHLQNDLKWDVHITKLIQEINAVSKAIKNIGNEIDDDQVLLKMYLKLICSRLSCMPSIYGTFAAEHQLKDLQNAQDKAIKKIFALTDDGDISKIYAKYGLLNVQQMIHYDLALLIYKWKNNLLKLNRSIDNMNSQNILSVGTKYFHKLDPTLKHAPDLDHFKNEFRRRCTMNVQNDDHTYAQCESYNDGKMVINPSELSFVTATDSGSSFSDN